MHASLAASASAAAFRAPKRVSRGISAAGVSFPARGIARAARPLVRCQAGPEGSDAALRFSEPPSTSSPLNGAAAQNNAIASQQSLSTDRNVESMRRAREIMAIDPTADNALDLVGTKVNMSVQFKVHYETKLGEDLFVIGSHERLGAWDIVDAVPMRWTEGGMWVGDVELPAGGVFFYKYVVKTLDSGFRWQDGANNLLVLPDPWDVPKDSVFVVDDQFGGLTREAQNQLAVKLVMTEKEKVGLKVEANKAKEMTKAALQELLLAREELREAKEKLAKYEANVASVMTSMNGEDGDGPMAR